MKPAIHEEIRGGAQHQTSPRADQQTFTLVNPHGHLPRWPRSLLNGADQWTLRAREPLAGLDPYDCVTSRARFSTVLHAMTNTGKA